MRKEEKEGGGGGEMESEVDNVNPVKLKKRK